MEEFNADEYIIHLQSNISESLHNTQTSAASLVPLMASKVITNEVMDCESPNILPELIFLENSTENHESSQLPQDDDDQNKSDELKTLLLSWKLENLLDKLIDEQVYVDILKIIKPQHVERLMRRLPLGVQILFEHCLENWRNEIGRPLDVCSNCFLRSSHDSPKTPSGDNCPTTSMRLSPDPRSESPPDVMVSLSDILNESARGTMIVQFFEKAGKLQDDQRNLLVNVICNYFTEKNIHMSLATSYRLEKEICARFPTEKLEFYRVGKRGKLYNKCCNQRSLFKPIYKLTTSKMDVSNKDEPSEKLVPEEDAQICERSLRFDNLSTEEFDRIWQACSKHRIKEVRQMESTSEILKKWPFYKEPAGYRLIDMDFAVLFKNSSNIMDKWGEYSRKISDFICKIGIIKDKSINALLCELKSKDKISENSRNATLLWALHGYLIPTQKSIVKDNTGRKSFIKYTIRDSQDAFLFVGKSTQQLDDHIKFVASKELNIQPFILALGEDILTIKEIYVYFDGIKFSFSNFLRAVDICFKIFHFFNLEYPLAATNFYIFIQELFYKIENSRSNKNSAKINILLNEINNQSQEIT